MLAIQVALPFICPVVVVNCGCVDASKLVRVATVASPHLVVVVAHRRAGVLSLLLLLSLSPAVVVEGCRGHQLHWQCVAITHCLAAIIATGGIDACGLDYRCYLQPPRPDCIKRSWQSPGVGTLVSFAGAAEFTGQPQDNNNPPPAPHRRPQRYYSDGKALEDRSSTGTTTTTKTTTVHNDLDNSPRQQQPMTTTTHDNNGPQQQ
ncbi:hypothetical protein EDB85DRAFT_1893032 [Lactarius pseudohatsudake]|nr:hypothetical protein EDB85DRAFT_1893032 [Lactarius pseudohatsudake]